LDPPPEADPSVAEVLAACSAAQYGRDAAVVAADRASVLERLDGAVSVEGSGRANVDPEGGRIPPASAGTVGPPPVGAARNEQRSRGASGNRGADFAAPQLTLKLEAAEPAASHGEEDDGTVGGVT
jgi:hypothetical protein